MPGLSGEQLRAFYDRFGSRQDWQALYEDPPIDDLIAHADFEHAAAVFELGCGTGRLARRLLAEHLPARARYVGVDISATMVALARRRVAAWAARAEIHVAGDDSTGGAPSGGFDRFVATYVLDLLRPEDIRAVLAEAHRLLRPGGRLCLISLTHGRTPFSRLVSRAWEAVYARRPGLVGGCRPIDLRPYVAPPDWEVLHDRGLAPVGVPSEVLVAARTASRESGARPEM